MAEGGDTRFIFQTLGKQLTSESSMLEAHLDALERAFAKIANADLMTTRLIAEAIRMKRRRLESIQRQLKRIERI
jgi:hypothetical protein